MLSKNLIWPVSSETTDLICLTYLKLLPCLLSFDVNVCFFAITDGEVNVGF